MTLFKEFVQIIAQTRSGQRMSRGATCQVSDCEQSVLTGLLHQRIHMPATGRMAQTY
jgi:hypothetical protein